MDIDSEKVEMGNNHSLWSLVFCIGVFFIVTPIIRLFNPPIKNYFNFFLVLGIGILLIAISIIKTSEKIPNGK